MLSSASSILDPRSSILSPLGGCQVPCDVLDYHDGIIDNQSDGDGQAAQRHQVERFAAPVKEKEGDRQRRGNGQGGDQRRAPASQKCQQDENTEQSPDQD